MTGGRRTPGLPSSRIGVVATLWGLVNETATLVDAAALAVIAAWVAVKDEKVRMGRQRGRVVYVGGFAAAPWSAADQQARSSCSCCSPAA